VAVRIGRVEREFILGTAAKRGSIVDDGEMRFCGIAFMELSARDRAMISLDHYGEEEGVAVGAGAGA
jgi:hypothetical protein